MTASAEMPRATTERLAIPLGVSGARRYVAQALELAPATKLLFATDAHTIPELYWAGAVAWRNAVAEVLEDLRRDRLLTAAEVTEWAELIFFRNALRIYQTSLSATGEAPSTSR